MNREHRDFIVFMGTVVIVVTIIVSVGIYVQHRKDVNQESVFSTRRRYIFCELLKPGMDKQTVLETIEQFGAFLNNEADIPSDDVNFEIFGRYDDPNVLGENEYITLVFRNGKYFDAFDEYHLEPISVCYP